MNLPIRAVLAFAIAGALSCATLPAYADLVIDADAPPLVRPTPPPAIKGPINAGSVSVPKSGPVNPPQMLRGDAKKNPGTVREVGTAPAAPAKAEGWADGVPVALALKQVLPSGWTLKIDGVDPEKTVSWSGGRPWTDVLRTLADRGSFDAEIRWADRTVEVCATKPKVEVVAEHKVNGIASDGDGKADTLRSETRSGVTSVAAPPVKPLVIPTWRLDPKLTLRENVDAWVKQAGWNKLVWEAADYQIMAPATFSGTFASPEGPLAKLIDAYETSDQPLLVELSTMDRVVHVSNKNYRPVVVESQTAQTFSPSSFGGPNIRQERVAPPARKN